MAGQFPGIDPYVEFQSSWLDFHNSLVLEIRNELGDVLPDSYVARVDERIEVATSALERPSSFRSDVFLGRSAEAGSRPVTGRTGKTALLEPQLMEVVADDPEELRITWVEIRALPDLELVTTIEILSPINKSWQASWGNLR